MANPSHQVGSCNSSERPETEKVPLLTLECWQVLDTVKTHYYC